MANYTSQNNIEKYLGVTLDAGLTTYVQSYLDAVDRWIENYIGTSYKDGGNPSTKYYDTNGLDMVYVDAFEGTPSEVSTLDADGDTEITLTAGEDYRTYPLNDTIKTSIRLMGNNKVGLFNDGRYRLKITANFGVASIPADITLAATMLVARIVEKNVSGGETKREKVGDVEFEYKDVSMDIDNAAIALSVYNLLDQYRDIPL